MSTHMSRIFTLSLALTLLAVACGDDISYDTSEGSQDVDVAMDALATEADGVEPADDTDGDDSGEDRGDVDEMPADSDMALLTDASPAAATTSVAAFGSLTREENRTAAQEEPEPAPEVPPEITALFVGRQIIKTGSVVLEAADVRTTTDRIVETVFANGGAIWGQESRTDPTPQTVLTIRVPPLMFEDLVAAITDVDGVGVISETVTSDDVTEVVVDLDARITAAESSVNRVRELLDDARDLNTIFRLEEELAPRQANLERLLGQRKTIGDQVALSTITLTIIELDPDRLDPAMEITAWLGTDQVDACPGRSDLSIGADDTAVLCVNVSNTGEDVLTDIDIAASTFRLRVDDFTVAPGNATIESLAPGDELLAYVELKANGGFIQRVDASNGIAIDVTVTVNPETSPTVELTGSDSVFISADVDDPLPGFGDSFSSGWNVMITVLSILMIIAGLALPFTPIIILAVWLGGKALIKSRERADASAAHLEAHLASQQRAQQE